MKTLHKDSNTLNAEKVVPHEYWTAFFIFAIGLFLRIIYIFHYHFDTDEPQHLHVVWAWTKGLLQYRDVFDNHAPLFHILYSPLLGLIGERSCALYIMRLAMVPLFIIAIVCTYIIGRNLFSRRVGIWSVALSSIYPDFLFRSLEFRADTLWMVLWLMGLAVILGRTLTPYRIFCAGLLFGLTLCTSMKTVLLLFTLAIAVIFTALPNLKYRKNLSWNRLFKLSISALVGFLLVPLVIISFFATQKALSPLFYCTITHNILPRLGYHRDTWRILVFLVLLPVVLLINRKYIYTDICISRSILFLFVTLYFLSLYSLWPIDSIQNFLPIYSLMAILFIAKLLKWIDLWRKKHVHQYITKFYPVLLLVSISALEIIVTFCLSPPWRNDTRKEIAKIDEVLKLTDRDDWVIDQKGETVFRPRPYYYKLETLTVERFRRGIIPDNITQELIAKRCFVASNDISRFPTNTRNFLWNEYISIGYMRVAGKFLEPCQERPNVYRFKVYIPTYYVIVGEYGEVKGGLDNSIYNGPRFLESGTHEFISDTNQQRLALLWAQAAERGFSPFRNLK